MISAESGSIFLAPMTAGGQKFDVVIDTGSSDTWLVLSNFTCRDESSDAIVPQQECYFGAYYSPTSTLHTIENENFNISYQDGEWLNGVMVREDVSLAGITVKQQEIALVTDAAWYGDGYSSGLIGLAYPLLTNAYSGNDPSDDVAGDNMPYAPLFTSMYEKGLTASMFSLALSRDASDQSPGAVSGGYLAIGGLPNIPHGKTFINTTINVVGVNTMTNDSIYEYYSITIDGWAFSQDKYVRFNPRDTTMERPVLDSGSTVIVDSGTSLIYAPEKVAQALAAQFDPPAQFDDSYGLFTVECDAQAPLFGVDIGKKIFYVNPVDMVLQESESLCIMGVQSNGGSFSVLGDVFLRNVLVVFDVGAAEMRFSAREFTGV